MNKKAKNPRLIFKCLYIGFAVILAACIACTLFLIMCEGNSGASLFGIRIRSVTQSSFTTLPQGTLAIIRIISRNADTHSNSDALSYGTQVEVVSSTSGYITSAAYAQQGAIIGKCIGQLPVLGAVLAFCAYTPIIGTLLIVMFTLLCILIATNEHSKTKVQKNSRLRMSVQFIWATVTNSYLFGFAKGTIYKGTLKSICVPGLNCYSCPGAYGACPLGALQAIFTKRNGFLSQIPFYVLGLIMLFGLICGRFICGFLCPFGLFQDLLYKVPLHKKVKINNFKTDKYLRYIKYLVLLLFVMILPLFTAEAFPWFCKLICPSGMLLGGIPLMAASSALRSASGIFTLVKLIILGVVIIASIIIFRPFCKYICPLGAIYGLFNRVSLLHYEFDADKCTHCGACARACDMGVDLTKKIGSAECIRCSKCINVCHTGALKKRFGIK